MRKNRYTWLLGTFDCFLMGYEYQGLEATEGCFEGTWDERSCFWYPVYSIILTELLTGILRKKLIKKEFQDLYGSLVTLLISMAVGHYLNKVQEPLVELYDLDWVCE